MKTEQKLIDHAKFEDQYQKSVFKMWADHFNDTVSETLDRGHIPFFPAFSFNTVCNTRKLGLRRKGQV